MKQYYMYVAVLLTMTGCSSHVATTQATRPDQNVSSRIDYSYIYTEMATSGSCRNNMSVAGGLSSKCQ